MANHEISDGGNRKKTLFQRKKGGSHVYGLPMLPKDQKAGRFEEINHA